MNKSKTVWDVVNEFKGEWSYSQQDDDEQLALYQFEYSHVFPGDEVGQIHKGHTGFNEDKYIKICTIAEFKALVMDMQLGLDVNSISYLESIHYEISNKTPLEPAVKKPLVYTQAMADNGVLPSVGMEYLDERNQLCKCLTNYDGFVIGEMLEHARFHNYPVISQAMLDLIKPIDTHTAIEKAINAAIGDLRFYGDQTQTEINATETLQAIIAGKIAGVKWTRG